jgi:hypothetical protein
MTVRVDFLKRISVQALVDSNDPDAELGQAGQNIQSGHTTKPMK